MFKKTITYTDFNDQVRTEDFYFHMSKAELLAMATEGNEMMKRIERITKAMDGRAIIAELTKIIVDAVGVRSEDGSRFIKDADAKSRLMDSPAFDELLMELSTDADASANFITQLIPTKMQEEMQKQLAKQKAEGVDPFKDPEKLVEDMRPAWVKEDREPTQLELRNMTQAELVDAFQMRAQQRKG